MEKNELIQDRTEVENLLENKYKIKCRIVTDPDLISKCQMICYDVLYVEKQVIQNYFKQGILECQIVETPKGIKLVDEFDPYSIWLAVFLDEKIICCGRIVLKRPSDNKSLSQILFKDLPEKYFGNNVVEFGRLCSLKEFRNTDGLLICLIFIEVFRWMKLNNKSLTYFSKENNVKTVTKKYTTYFESNGVIHGFVETEQIETVFKEFTKRIEAITANKKFHQLMTKRRGKF